MNLFIKKATFIKYTVFSFYILCFSSFSYANHYSSEKFTDVLIIKSTINDSLSFDSRLLQIYDISYLEKIRNNNPALLMFLNYKLDNSYIIIDIPKEKEFNPNGFLSNVKNKTKHKDLKLDPLRDFEKNKLNIFFYDFEIEKFSRSIFIIDGTQKAMLFYSKDELIKKFKKSFNN